MMMVPALQSCYYDNVEELYPETANCNTDDMSYTNDVWPVINSSCVGCHGGAAPAGGIPLKNYDDIAASAAIPSGTYGSLYGTISHSPGNSPMPKNAPMLSDCTIAQIKAWIEQGALNN
jgi:mono/diheme cytochrome c family protein